MDRLLSHIFRKNVSRSVQVADKGQAHLDNTNKDGLESPHVHLDQKIHHDLEALVKEPLFQAAAVTPTPTNGNAKETGSSDWSRCGGAEGFLPLKPNINRHPSLKKPFPTPLPTPKAPIVPTTVITRLPTSTNNPHRPPATTEVSFTSSTVSSDSRNTSVGTFGTRPPWKIREYIEDVQQTPASGGESSPRRLRRLSSHSRTATHSHESMSKRSRRSSMSSVSRDTFGKASPSRSPTNVRRPRQPSVAAPPLPPLIHPAFSAASAFLSRDSSAAEHRPRLARNAHSTPLLQERTSTNEDGVRTRTRTSSSGRSTSLGAAARILVSESPNSGFAHATSESVGRRRSQSSATSRRGSLESPRGRKTSLQNLQNVGEAGNDWEAEVSKAIVRLSLESCHGREYQAATSSRKGNARGDRAQRTRSLGSPFFLSDAHSCYPKVTLSDNLTARYNSATIHKSVQVKKSSPIFEIKPNSSHHSRIMNPSSRSRTPSPPSKTTSTPRRPSPLASASHLVPPSVSITGPTPDTSPIFPSQQPPDAEPTRSNGLPPTTPPPLQTPSSSMSKGKRKAEEYEGGTPPKDGKEQHTTFAADPRPHRPSGGSSYAPSSYHHRKRARLAVASDSRPGSRPDSRASADIQTAKTTGSWSSRTSQQPPPRSVTPGQQPHRAPSRRSMRSLSQASMPLSALISPHAPSITPSGVFHMRDPRKPAPIQATPWSLSLPSGPSEPNEGWRGWVERGGSPLHAWLFFMGFVLFPLWWVASFLGIPKTRRVGGSDAEKGVVLDDPQLEYDSYSWRKRCRILAVVSIFTYIPFIALVAVFASR